MSEFIIDEWVNYASIDCSIAQHLRDTMHPKPLEAICYHCQQSAEKALKAFLLCMGEEPPRTHDLELLRGKCETFDEAFKDLSSECDRLKLYASQPRYPFGLEITDGIMNIALADCERILEYAKAGISREKSI